MKSKILILTIFLFTTEIIISQVTPINIEYDNNNTYYHTSGKSNYQSLYENQSYELFTKIKNDVKLVDNVALDFIEFCIDEPKLNNIEENGAIIIFEFYIDQSGNVKTCSLKNYGNKVNFTNEEIKCILSEAMQVNIGVSFEDNTPFNFYFKAIKRYKLY